MIDCFTFNSYVQVIQDTFLIKDACRALVQRDAEFRSRADAMEAKAKALVDQVPCLEVQVEPEIGLKSSRDSFTELGGWGTVRPRSRRR